MLILFALSELGQGVAVERRDVEIYFYVLDNYYIGCTEV